MQKNPSDISPVFAFGLLAGGLATLYLTRQKKDATSKGSPSDGQGGVALNGATGKVPATSTKALPTRASAITSLAVTQQICGVVYLPETGKLMGDGNIKVCGLPLRRKKFGLVPLKEKGSTTFRPVFAWAEPSQNPTDGTIRALYNQEANVAYKDWWTGCAWQAAQPGGSIASCGQQYAKLCPPGSFAAKTNPICAGEITSYYGELPLPSQQLQLILVEDSKLPAGVKGLKPVFYGKEPWFLKYLTGLSLLMVYTGDPAKHSTSTGAKPSSGGGSNTGGGGHAQPDISWWTNDRNDGSDKP